MRMFVRINHGEDQFILGKHVICDTCKKKAQLHRKTCKHQIEPRIIYLGGLWMTLEL